ncbi:4Fe-4S binding protein [Rhodopila sp.]|uniref:4Fe-4S binding protein n=1 Tax=Rhodopila sp. TaxID=2480087 RepID=UPI002BD85767|nr:4Fe-4S binding protein [Rhodopila sp.]HVZ08255.1 4Fe-4S binding protein [Rhodopila sp.]
MPDILTLPALNRPPSKAARRGALAGLGDWMARHRGVIQAIQWVVVLIYLVLVAIPAFLPLPDNAAHIWTNLTLAAQFAFWGVWWPFVLLSMVLIGRTWCGVFCPEGALTEFASRKSLNRAVPRWITWRGWPFTAFVCTTVYGQMVSVYQYPAPVLVVLGGSTMAAIGVGLVYGRNKRVWCRYLCPVNGVFNLLSRLSPVHYRVDRDAWAESQRLGQQPAAPGCAPLVPIRTMRGAAECHMCGRCSGFRGAISLELRPAGQEVVHEPVRSNPWDTALILLGLLGVASGAFLWSSSPWYVDIKQALATWLIDRGWDWPLNHSAPWFVLTNYPAQNDVLTLLDGALMLGFIGAAAVGLGLAFYAILAIGVRLAGPWSSARFHHLALSLIPTAGAGVFLGLSANTVTLLHAEQIDIPMLVLADLRAALIAGAAAWSVGLAWRIAGRWQVGLRRFFPPLSVAACSALAACCWILLFWLW